MFEDIAQMEKEIEEFRKNIIASSDLINSIADLTKVTKEQKDSFDASAEKLIQKLDSCIVQFKVDHDDSIDKMKKSIADDMQEWMSNIEKIKTSIEAGQTATTQKNEEQIKQFASESERILDEMKNTISAQQEAFSQRVNQTEELIRGYQKEAENKYNEFINVLESTNVDQIFKEVQSLKQSMQTKFIIAMAGIGVTLIAVAISLILK
ncbi:MAG: hypothetical protein K5664_00045 [Firmicutes bacterium]|nr:hypothetical protein [Bacillota bacterium]